MENDDCLEEQAMTGNKNAGEEKEDEDDNPFAFL